MLPALFVCCSCGVEEVLGAGNDRNVACPWGSETVSERNQEIVNWHVIYLFKNSMINWRCKLRANLLYQPAGNLVGTGSDTSIWIICKY